jgi:signal transduction histidine kinase
MENGSSNVKGQINQTQRMVILVVIGVLALLYAALFVIVFRADQTIQRQVQAIVSAEQKAQQARQEAETANQAKSEFVTFVAHELKVPLTSIQGYAELVDKVAPVQAQQERFLNVIVTNVEYMVGLISDLTDLTRLESGQMKMDCSDVLMAEIARQAEHSLRAAIDGKQQSLVLEISNDLPQVWGDPKRLLQVMLNLLSNASKYTPENGKIWLRLAKVQQQERVFILCEVEDTGLGIAPEEQPKIFEKFFRSGDSEARQSPGTGLGLSLARLLVEMHGGRIWFKSAYRQGTTFSFELPVKV